MLNKIRVPADWEPVESVWIAWPHNRDTWPGSHQGKSRFDFAGLFFQDLVRLIAQSVPVQVLATGDIGKSVASQVCDSPEITVVDIATNDAWIRDYGPTFVRNRDDDRVSGIHWRYNAWGGKYPPWDDDAAAGAKICEAARLRRQSSDLCVEGGALEFDGDRRLITTTDCLIDERRNPGWNKERISREIYRRTGVTEIVWIEDAELVGDDTDGHIDQLARFVDQQNIVVATAEPDDENFESLSSVKAQLKLWGTSTQPCVEVHSLPIPPARYIDGQRIPESYCNYLRLGPDRILMPTFDSATDEPARGCLAELTGASVDTIDCRDLAWGLGTLHCCSREQPKTTNDEHNPIYTADC